jgi:type IV conjugative transfer system protein TraL
MKKCPRTLDRPILIFGLEPEDVAVVAASSGIIMLFFDTFYGGLVFFGGWFLLKVLKRGKPPGYITHLFYRYGVNIEGLVDSPKKVNSYSAY